MRIGLIGAGALGALHAVNLEAVPDCRLVAVSSEQISPAALEASRSTGADTMGGNEALLDPDRVDAVIIATPTDTHAHYALRAIDAGLSVFVEKPLARTPEEARLVRDRAAARGVKLAVGHVVRYFPEYAAARDLVQEGRLGTVSVARLARLNTAPAGVGEWYGDVVRSGGVLLDMAIHDVDWCLWTFGPAARVYAVSAGGPDGPVVALTIRHTAGTISYIDASWREESFTTRLEVAGTQGLYRADGSGSAGFTSARGDAQTYLPPASASDDPYVMELRAAIDWFRGGPPPRATVADACDAVEVIEAAQRSIDTGRAIALEGALA
ncbi:Gfo/Idh/MocA family oxidoreductase [Streptomyces sp. NBC_00879]|uniref:Gfo/Idh/MocA family protein n=1 Tax=Streptomyces sp. NBC_00879 TaxID=2975855 RepID=UPI0038676D96|nr:Gfo/Idh/MocA family oxidoreductase [Streptomyces sp. NBC_00879]